MRKNRPSIFRGIVTGIAAGITATLIMDQFQKLSTAAQKETTKKIKLAQGESKWTIAHEQVASEQQAATQEGSTEIVARKIAEADRHTTRQRGEEDSRPGRPLHLRNPNGHSLRHLRRNSA